VKQQENHCWERIGLHSPLGLARDIGRGAVCVVSGTFKDDQRIPNQTHDQQYNHFLGIGFEHSLDEAGTERSAVN